MQFKIPKNNHQISWTKHAIEKMKFYHLSESRLKKVLKQPKRKEKGIAPNTIAIMQPVGSKKRSQEIWLMYQTVNQKIKTCGERSRTIRIISAWRYPGVSPIGKKIPIPDDILQNLDEIIET